VSGRKAVKIRSCAATVTDPKAKAKDGSQKTSNLYPEQEYD